MKNVKVILIPVEYTKSRKVCEQIESMPFKTFEDVMTKIKKELGEPIKRGVEILVYPLTDFMEVVNDQDLDVLTEYFISYVQID